MSNFFSEEYMNVLKKHHEDKLNITGKLANEDLEYTGWGIMSYQMRFIIKQLADEFGTESIIDYGCGSGVTLQEIMPEEYDVLGYDPAVPGKENNNVPRDFLVSCDVLEHVEEEYIDNVIADMRHCSIKHAFVTISLTKAIAILPDGRNAHVTVKPKEWWIEKFNQHYSTVKVNEEWTNMILLHCQV